MKEMKFKILRILLWLNTFEKLSYQINTETSIENGQFGQHWIGQLLIAGWWKTLVKPKILKWKQK